MTNEILTNGEGLTQISEEFYMNETTIFHKVENKTIEAIQFQVAPVDQVSHLKSKAFIIFTIFQAELSVIITLSQLTTGVNFSGSAL